MRFYLVAGNALLVKRVLFIFVKSLLAYIFRDGGRSIYYSVYQTNQSSLSTIQKQYSCQTAASMPGEKNIIKTGLIEKVFCTQGLIQNLLFYENHKEIAVTEIYKEEHSL